MAGTYPALEVSFAPGVAASDVPAGGDWIDISSYVAYLNTVVGRDDEFSQPSAGQLDLGLDNADGRFDPDNASGPYYGDLLPLVWFRVVGGGATATSGVFYGQVSIEGWRLTASPFPGLVTVEVLDFEQLANTDLPGSVYAIEVETDGPEVWWRLDESDGTVATDSSGNGHHAELTDGVTFNSRTGLIAGDDDNALLIDPGRLQLPAGAPVRSDWDFTVAGWVDIPAAVTYDGTIFRQSNHGEVAPGGIYSSVFVGFKAMAGEAYPYVEVIVNGTAAADGTYRQSSTPLAAGIHRIAAYIPAVAAAVPTNLKLRVDGASVTGTTGGALTVMPAFPSDLIYTDAGSDATLDEIAVFDGELGAVRDAAQYSAGSAPWASELSGARINHLLDAAGVSASLRNIDAGFSTVQQATLADDVLSAVLEVTKAERGEFYIDHADGGKIRFRGRHARWTETRSLTSQATFGDGGGSEVPYESVDIQDDRIINRDTAQRKNGAAITVSDAASEVQYQRRSYSETGLLYETDAESEARANLIVAEKKDRHRRVRSMILAPLEDADLAWAQVFARQIGDRITVKWRPLYGGTYTYVCWIEGIRHTYDAEVGRLRTRFSLSPVPYGATAEPYFIVGTSTIGGPARIGY